MVFDSVFEFFDAGFMTEIIADLSRVVFTIGPRPTQLSVQGWAMLPYHVSSGASTSLGGQAPSLDAAIRLPSRLGDCSHKVCPNARLIRMMMARISRNLNRSVRHETSVLVFTILHTYIYSFITSCQTQPYMRAEIAQPTAKTIVTQLQFVLY